MNDNEPEKRSQVWCLRVKLNVTIGHCVADLELIDKVYEPQDLSNPVEYLPL